MNIAARTLLVLAVASLRCLVPSALGQTPPYFDMQPMSTGAACGATASFESWGWSTSPWDYHWFKDGAPLRDSERISGSQALTLRLTNLLSSDAGIYTVMLSNELGTAISVPAALRVVPPVAFTRVGDWPGEPRGSAMRVQIDGSLAYVGTRYGGLVIFDIADAAHPRRLSYCYTGDQTANWGSLVITNGLCYFNDTGSGLHIVDVSDPAEPRLLSRTECGHYTGGVAVKGSHAFVACGSDGVKVFDVSDPAEPLLVAQFPGTQIPGQIVIEGDLAYVADYGVGIYDVSKPSAPQLLSYFDAFSDVSELVVRDGIGYVASEFFGMVIGDFRDPTSPAMLHAFPLPDATFFNGIQLQGDRVFLETPSASVEIFDVSSTTNPVHEFSVTNLYAVHAQPAGRYFWMATYDDGLLNVDLSNPTNPVLVGKSAPMGGLAAGIDVGDSLACVADRSRGLQVLDVSDSNGPVRIGSVDTDGWSEQVVMQGSLALLADGPGGLKVFDLGNPAQPQLLATYPTTAETTAVKAQGTLAFVLNTPFWSGTPPDGFVILDLADPSNPIQLTARPIPHGRDIVVAGQTAFISTAANKIHAYNVADPSNPVLLSRFRPNTDGGRFHLRSNLLFAASPATGLSIFDVSNPSNVVLISKVPTRNQDQRVTVAGHYAFVSAGPELLVFDIANLQLPALAGTFPARGNATDCRVVGNNVFLANSQWGVDVLKFETVLALDPPSRMGNNLLLHWASTPGVTLQTTTRLERDEWQDVPGSDGTNSAQVPITGNAYFRLKQP